MITVGTMWDFLSSTILSITEARACRVVRFVSSAIASCRSVDRKDRWYWRCVHDCRQRSDTTKVSVTHPLWNKTHPVLSVLLVQNLPVEPETLDSASLSLTFLYPETAWGNNCTHVWAVIFCQMEVHYTLTKACRTRGDVLNITVNSVIIWDPDIYPLTPSSSWISLDLNHSDAECSFYVSQ